MTTRPVFASSSVSMIRRERAISSALGVKTSFSAAFVLDESIPYRKSRVPLPAVKLEYSLRSEYFKLLYRSSMCTIYNMAVAPLVRLQNTGLASASPASVETSPGLN